MTAIPPNKPIDPLLLTLKSTDSKKSESQALHEKIPSLKTDNPIDNIIYTISNEDIKSLEQITTELEEEVEALNKYLTSDNVPNEKLEMAEKIIGVFIKEHNTNELAAKTTKIGAKTISVETDNLTKYHNATETIALASTIVSELINLSHLFRNNSLLSTQQEQLRKLEEQDPDGKETIMAKEMVAKLESEVSSANKAFAVNAILQAPGLADDIYAVIRIISSHTEIASVSAGLGIANGIAAIIMAGRGMQNAKRKEASHTREIENLKPAHFVENVASLSLEIQEEAIKPLDEPLLFNKMTMDHYISVRKKNFDARAKNSGPSFDRWINQLMENNSKDFNQFKVELEKKGFDLDDFKMTTDGKKLSSADIAKLDPILRDFAKSMQEKGVPISNFEDFKKELANNPELKKALLTKFFEHQDTLTSVSKNLLRERLLANEKVNHEFFSFKTIKSKAMFAVTVIAVTAGITLTVASLAGVAFPPALALVPGILGLAAIYGFMGLGLYHLSRNKPNIASTVFRFVKLNILLNQIPLMFSNWRLTKAKQEQARLQEKVDFYSQKLLTNAKRIEKFERYQAQKEEADKNVQFCEERYQRYFDKIQALEDEITQARIDDFKLNSGFDAFTRKGPVKYTKVKTEITEKNPAGYRVDSEEFIENIHEKHLNKEYLDSEGLKEKDLKDEFSIISDALIEGEFWKDPEAQAFLEKYGGVELAKEVMLDRSTSDADSKFLSEKLRHMILKNSGEVLAWLEKQEIRN